MMADMVRRVRRLEEAVAVAPCSFLENIMRQELQEAVERVNAVRATGAGRCTTTRKTR